MSASSLYSNLKIHIKKKAELYSYSVAWDAGSSQITAIELGGQLLLFRTFTKQRNNWANLLDGCLFITT